MIAGTSERTGGSLLSRVNPTMIGLWIFIGTESLFFGMLIGSYLYLRVRSGVWPPEGMERPDAILPLINTVVLFSSGATMHAAHLGMRQGDTGLLRSGIVATIVLGAAFLTGQLFEYIHAGFGLSSGLLGASFFTLTGFHGAHVLVGLIFLALVLAKAGRGDYDAEHHLGVEASALYWHFVDAVWVAVLAAIYLV